MTTVHIEKTALYAIAVVAFLSSGCLLLIDTGNPDRRPCDDTRTCPSGFACVDSVCVSATSGCEECRQPVNGEATCIAGTCGFRCLAGFHKCGDGCASDSDVATCGSRCEPCVVPPNATANTCSAGMCDFTCASGFNKCGTSCVPGDSILACGGSCQRCSSPIGGSALCDGGSCVSTCPSGFTLCGSACVNLQTDSANCGACGYAVVSAASSIRTCVSGRPQPAWIPVRMAGGPQLAASWTGYTGRRLLHVSQQLDNGTDTWLYDLQNEAWSPGPLKPFTSSPAGIVAFPRRRQMFFGGGGGSTDTQSFLFDDVSGAGTWRTLTKVGGPADRIGPAVAGDDEDAYILWGTTSGFTSQVNDGARYHLDAGTWEQITPLSRPCAQAVGPYRSPFVPAGGHLVAFNDYALNSGYCNDPAAYALSRSSLTWTRLPISPSPRIYPTILSLGPTALIFGGRGPGQSNNCLSCPSLAPFILDPATGLATPLSKPAGADGFFGFSSSMGRSVFYWGGYVLNCPSGNCEFTGVTQSGVLGALDGTSVAWWALPAANQPSARCFGDHNGQRLWTGREMLVYGGILPQGGAALGGARFQPPVGCVCPSTEDACGSVSGVTSACAPY